MKIGVLLKIAVAVVAIACAALCAQASDSEVTPEVEKALLAENWGKVADLLTKVDAESPSPVLRLLKGHACLALNRNNESLFLFLVSTDAKDLGLWTGWSESFVQSHQNSPIAHYFHGDSLARLGKYADAIQAFERGLKVSPGNPLLLNALGVASAKLNKMDDARKAFKLSIAASKETLADAYCNLGASWIQSQEGAEGAATAFGSGAKLSPNFALALHGRMCSKLVQGLSDSDGDCVHMYAGAEMIDDLITDNMVLWAERVASADKHVAQFLAELKGAGTSLQRTYHTAVPQLTSAAGKIYAAEAIANNKQILEPIRNFLSESYVRSAYKDIKVAADQHGFGVVNQWRRLSLR